MNDRPIGVFDSGLGGLTVLQALADLLPDEHLVYLGDTARYPYGPRSSDELIAFSRQIVDLLLEHGVKLIVVACNSATAAAIEVLQGEYDVPIIGVVEPGVRAAVKATTTGRVGVVGTAMTASSKVYEHTAERLRAPLDLHVRACPEFVTLVEDGEVTGEHAEDVVARGLAPFADDDIDTLVLGCTHFPLLSRTIGEAMGRDVTLVSSAEEIAFEVLGILERTGWMRPAGHSPATRRFFTSGDPARFAELGARFLGAPLGDVRSHAWPSDDQAT